MDLDIIAVVLSSGAIANSLFRLLRPWLERMRGRTLKVSVENDDGSTSAVTLDPSSMGEQEISQLLRILEQRDGH